MFRLKHDARGIAYVENAGFRFVVCIPSRKREEVVQRCPLLPVANVVVHESEYDSYARAFHDQGATFGALLTHNVQGMGRIRNHLLHVVRDKDRDEFVMQIDDEHRYLAYMMTRRAGSKAMRATEVWHQLDIFCHDALVARELPTGLFGYAALARPQERRSYDPFNIRNWVTVGCSGTLDKELRFDENLFLNEDIDFCLQVIAKYKVILRDQRWAGMPEMYEGRTVGTPGGLADVRTTEMARQTIRYLQAKWGASVIVDDPAKIRQRGKVGFKLTVAVPQHHVVDPRWH